MSFSGLSWVGVTTTDFEGTVMFFADVVGLRLLRRDPGAEVAQFRLANGDMFEVFGPRHPDQAGEGQAMVMAFEVDDLEAARAEMESRGVTFITEPESWRGHSWCYFQGPDGLVYEIKQIANS